MFTYTLSSIFFNNRADEDDATATDLAVVGAPVMQGEEGMEEEAAPEGTSPEAAAPPAPESPPDGAADEQPVPAPTP